MSGSISDNVFRASGVIAAAAAGRTGTVDWQTDSIKTAGFTAADAEGYFCNTTGGAFTVALPAGTAGAIVAVSDYASTWQTNNLTVSPNGSDNINGVNDNLTLSTKGLAVSLVYADATKGWKSVTGSDADATGVVPAWVAASGGDSTVTSGDYKYHTFLGDGPLDVTDAGSPGGSDTVDYIVIGGGGGGGSSAGGGGGGAGGYREGYNPASYTASPLATTALSVSVQDYTIDIGGGGAGGPSPNPGTGGSSSTFSSIISAGGGYGGGSSPFTGGTGGSGGGGGNKNAASGGAGNTPSTSPAQGFAGGASNASAGNPDRGGGGGGATVAGEYPTGTSSGAGGTGATTEINNAPNAYAGGGGGGKDEDPPHSGASGEGGTGGGGRGASSCPNSIRAGAIGTANTGGGGGGGGAGTYPSGYAGGSGIVIVRYKYQN
jgi:hypothetical protein